MVPPLDPQSQILRQRYDFKWEVLDIIVGGRSPIDVAQGGFSIRSKDEARQFIEHYGYDLERPIENAEVQGNFREALSFIQKFFLKPSNPEGLELEVPRKILELEDPSQLFLMASLHYADQTADRAGVLLRDWACAVLKVMHTITHIDKDVRTSYFADVQQQILDRFYKVVHRDEEGKLYLGQADDPLRIPLVLFETKPKKTRDSIILKLLHKRENVAEEVFDRVGLRFITEDALGCFQAIRFLKEKMLILWPNIKSSRSRNTLLDVDPFRECLDGLFRRLDQGEVISEEAFRAELSKSIRPPGSTAENPHTSDTYRAVQFTSRQLIKLTNPIYNEIRDLKAEAKSASLPAELAARLERLDLKYLQKEVRFFYPFEIQLMDKEGFEESERGRSAHSEYKRAQVGTALRRVMGSLADAAQS